MLKFTHGSRFGFGKRGKWDFGGRDPEDWMRARRMVLLDFTIVGVGYYRPLLPIFAKDILHVGPAGYGMLSSAPAIGGVLGTVIILFFGDIKRKGQLALWSFLAYALALGIFAQSTRMSLSLFLLGVLGLANSLQAVMRQTSFHLLTPDHVRGRAFSVFNMFSQGANSVGAAEIGFMPKIQAVE